MKLTIEIDMDNEAFTDNQGYECARILRNLSKIIDGSSDIADVKVPIYDAIGTEVGTMEVTDN